MLGPLRFLGVNRKFGSAALLRDRFFADLASLGLLSLSLIFGDACIGNHGGETYILNALESTWHGGRAGEAGGALG